MVKNQSSERVDLILKELVQAYPRIVDVWWAVAGVDSQEKKQELRWY